MKANLCYLVFVLIAFTFTNCSDPKARTIKGKVVRVEPSEDPNRSTTIVFQDGRKHEFKLIPESITGKECIIQFRAADIGRPDSITHMDCE